MKVKLRAAIQAPHPEFLKATAAGSGAKEAYVRAARDKTGPPMEITLPVGHIIDDPKAWAHCVPGYMNAPPPAEPADDEARETVKAMMDGPYRQSLEDLDQRVRVAALNGHNEAGQTLEQLRDVAIAYGRYSGELDEAIDNERGIVRVEYDEDDE